MRHNSATGISANCSAHFGQLQGMGRSAQNAASTAQRSRRLEEATRPRLGTAAASHSRFRDAPISDPASPSHDATVVKSLRAGSGREGEVVMAKGSSRPDRGRALLSAFSSFCEVQ